MCFKRNQKAGSLALQRDHILRNLNSQAGDPFRLIAEGRRFMRVMFDDVDTATTLSGQDPDNQTWRRIVVRLCFSAIDAMCSDSKRIIYCFLKYKLIAPTRKDLKFITGIDDNKGELSVFRPTLEENIKYITGRLASFSKNPWKIGNHNVEWQAFCASGLLRDRLTHPKCLADLAVNDLEYEKVADSLLWLQNGLNQIISGISPKQHML